MDADTDWIRKAYRRQLAILVTAMAVILSAMTAIVYYIARNVH